MVEKVNSSDFIKFVNELARSSTQGDDVQALGQKLLEQGELAAVLEGLNQLSEGFEALLPNDDRTFTTIGSGVSESVQPSIPAFGSKVVESSIDGDSKSFSGTQFGDRYTLGKELARGGVGVINQAFEKPLRRHLVVKRLIDQKKASRYVVEKFIEEAQITAQLEHPNIVPVHDLGHTDRGEIYFSMKYVSGESLKAIIKRLDKNETEGIEAFSRARMLNIFQSICMAMAFAHARGIIHRDIKPANIMVGEFGETLVLDWGVAKLMGRAEETAEAETTVTTSRSESADETQMGLVTGTPAYMAPEQAAGRIDRLDQRTDIFSLGVLLYEMLVFRSPFRKPSQRETLRAVIVDAPPPFDTWEHASPVPLTLQKICMKCLEKKPRDRYQGVEEILKDLLGYLDGVEDVDRRKRLSRAQLMEGLEAVHRFEEMNERLKAVESELYDASWETPTFAPVEQRRKVWTLSARASALKVQSEKAFAGSVGTLSEAVSLDESNTDAADELARLYWSRLKDAELLNDAAAAIYYRDAVERYDRGLFTERLKGEGQLSVNSSPTEVNVSLAQVMEVDLRATPLPFSMIGRSPILNHRLREGNWVVKLSKPGYADLIYPVRIRRGEMTKIQCTLLRPEHVGEHYLYVPGGPCIVGGDPSCPSSSARRRIEIPGFLMARYPVTCAEYLAFLRALDTTDPHEAQRRVPRLHANGGFLWQRNAQRTFELPDNDGRGLNWSDYYPVVGISHSDAIAFCHWYSQAMSIPVRLPQEYEWEKAARGPDERVYPWGESFDALFCKTADSRSGGSSLENVGSFPYDCSPYGIYDMSGLVSEYCDTDFSAKDGRKVIRGGNYLSQGPTESRATFRAAVQPDAPSLRYGFRMARDLT